MNDVRTSSLLAHDKARDSAVNGGPGNAAASVAFSAGTGGAQELTIW
jgi:hypothetical protein